MSKALKKQVGGDHYNKNVIQPWHIIDSHKLNFYEGNAIKYILRKKGNRVEDLKKAIHYIEREIELLNEHEGQTKMNFEEVEAVELKSSIDKGTLGQTTSANPPYHAVDSIFNGHMWIPIDTLEGRALYRKHHDVTAHDPLYTSE